jgi:nucleotide-binding universal stress UspA family protein
LKEEWEMIERNFKKILVPLDGSDIATRILPIVLELGKRLNAKVLLHSVIDPMTYKPLADAIEAMVNSDPYGYGSDRLQESLITSTTIAAPFAIVKERADQYLALETLKLAQHGIDAKALVTTGEPADEIIREAEINQCDLIAMSTHGRSLITGTILGSVTTNVVRNTKVPVLVIAPEGAGDYLNLIRDSDECVDQMAPGESHHEAPTFYKLLYHGLYQRKESLASMAVLLDGSELAEGVLPFVEILGQALTLDILLLRVIKNELPYLETPDTMIEYSTSFQTLDDALVEQADGYLNEKAEALRETGLKVRAQVLRGPPVSTIIDYVHQNQVSMIAMTTHGRSGMKRWMLGSVAENLIRNSRRPVLIIPPEKPTHDC